MFDCAMSVCGGKAGWVPFIKGNFYFERSVMSVLLEGRMSAFYPFIRKKCSILYVMGLWRSVHSVTVMQSNSLKVCGIKYDGCMKEIMKSEY